MNDSNWEVAIVMYMLHLNMTRKEACDALGIPFREASEENNENIPKLL
ncbi:hypothetical protein M9194_13590 [Vibrio sp. S4M6]|nr:hypothetical protein [Vibrio sinus]MCL9782462.1 hypothetical protein [Vibrio sinus]